MDNEGVSVSLLLIHEHLMAPWNDLRRGDCCERFESTSDGYYCKSCDIFVHKKCAESSESIEHPSHSTHALFLCGTTHICELCQRSIPGIGYRCRICDFDLDLYCAKSPLPEIIDVPEKHHHKLTFLKEVTVFDCDACGDIGDEFPYKCHECDLTFHIDCAWHPSKEHQSEVNSPYHSWHPLKLLTGQPPSYSDGKCRLCGRKIDIFFYHCSSCNFTLDMRCILNPPPQSLLDLKVHDHQLTLLPRLRSFTCNACGLIGDRSPYICVQCDFMIHQECLTLPRVINVNRHDHRISRTSILGVVNSICGVCRKKVDWTCGGYICQRCPQYVVHSKCATRDDVWNGKELEEIPEETEDIEPYVVIDDNTIQHFSHKAHYLRLNGKGLLWEENKRCNACTHPVSLESFYGCMECEFILHKNCAESPRKKWHMLHNERLTLVTREDNCFHCHACQRMSNGFMYQHGTKEFDVRCISVTEPFFHPSHPQHPLYNTEDGGRLCNGCNGWAFGVLRCIEDNCDFALDFKCATLPQVVKHRVEAHPLSLCYGEKANGKYWCDICEKETNPETWFYTSKDHQASLHTKCVLGDFARLMPRGTVKFLYTPYEVVLNNSMARPFCIWCESRCIPSIILKMPGTSYYYCSLQCIALEDESFRLKGY